jgi:hypothetical protein
MNCKQVNELLPLHAGGDLEEKRELRVAAHLESCADCAFAASEYRETRQMLKEFAPPAFSDGVYAGIRQRVWREIESESSAATWSQTVAGLFRPRLAWAVAGALLIAISVSALYFFADRQSNQNQLAIDNPASGAPQVDDQKTSQSSRENQTVTSRQQQENGRPPQAIPRPQRRRDRDMIAKAGSPPKSPSMNPEAPSSENTSVNPEAFSAPDSEKVLRVEMQTKDPNIRIIWFTPQEPKPSSRNSKGI